MKNVMTRSIKMYDYEIIERIELIKCGVDPDKVPSRLHIKDFLWKCTQKGWGGCTLVGSAWLYIAFNEFIITCLTSGMLTGWKWLKLRRSYER